MRLTRTLLAMTLAGAAVGVASGPAQAAPPPPSTSTAHLPGQDTAGADGFCPFPVTIVTTSYSELRGGTKYAGRGTATVTNDVTGKTITYNISGPGTITGTPDGGTTVDAGGPNLFWTTVANSYPGVPQIAYTTGHVQFTVDSAGRTTQYSLTGRSTDVCAALS